MQKLKIKYYIIFFIVFSIQTLYSGSKDDVYNKLKSKISNSSSIYLEFQINSNSDDITRFYGKKSGEYRLELYENTIISDGKTIWNLHSDNSVLVSDVSARDMSLVKLFFEVLTELVPVKLTEVKHSELGKHKKLELKSKGENKFNIDRVEVFVDSNMNIKELFISGAGNDLRYFINKIEYNVKLENNLFSLDEQDPDYDIIDYR